MLCLIVCQLCQVMRRMISVITRPMIGSAIGAPSATKAAAGQDAEADKAIDACVIAVCHQRRAAQAVSGLEPDLRGDFVTHEADHTGCREPPKVGEGCAGG